MQLKIGAAILLYGGFVILSGCSSMLEVRQMRNLPEYASQKPLAIPAVPFYPQQEYQCGPAALAILLSWTGVKVTPDQLTPLVYVPNRKGSFQVEMIAAARQFERIPYVIKPNVRTLMDEISAGNPVLIFQNLGLQWYPEWHYAVVTGIDLVNNTIRLNSGTIENYIMNLETFERTWQRAQKWAMVVLAPGSLPADGDDLSYVKAVSFFETAGKLELTLQAYKAGIKRWPESVLLQMGIGNTYYQQHNLGESRRYYQRATELDGSYAPAHNNLAQVLFELGLYNDALQQAKLAVQLGGNHINSYQNTLTDIEKHLTGVDKQ